MRAARRLVIAWLVLAELLVQIPLPTGFASVSASISAQSATLDVDPPCGAPGSTVTISGSGWRTRSDSGNLLVYWDSELLRRVPQGSGQFQTTITVPSNASSGSHRIIVTTEASGARDTAQRSFTVPCQQPAAPSNPGGGAPSGGAPPVRLPSSCSAPPARSIQPGQTLQGNLCAPDQSDRFGFQGTAGSTVVITMNRTSDSLDPYLWLGSGAPGQGGYLLASDDDSGGDRNARIEYTLPTTGSYEIAAESFNHASTGTYTLTLTLRSSAPISNPPVAPPAPGPGPSQGRCPTPPTDSSQSVRVSVGSNGFSPNTLTITAGTLVFWVNESGRTATVNSDDHPTYLLTCPVRGWGDRAEGPLAARAQPGA